MTKSTTDDTKAREIDEHISFHAQLEKSVSKELGEGVIEATITTASLDHHNEKINMDGVDTSQYHGTVLYGHDYQGLPIGKTISLTKMKNKIKAKFQLAVKEYPFAATVYDLIQGGYLTDVSIGGIVKKWSDDFMTIEQMVMKEFSVVPIGANPDAMISMKSIEGKSIDLQAQYEEFVHKSILDKLGKMPDDEVTQAVKVLESMVVTLKEAAIAQSDKDVQPEVKRIRRLTLNETALQTVKQSEQVRRTIKVKLQGE